MLLPHSLLQEAISYLRQRIPASPDVALVLGSGLGDFADQLRRKVIVSSADIPHYPRPTIEGHRGRLVFGFIGKLHVMAFQGRVHFYETGDLEQVILPVQVAHGLKAKILFVTNAAGGINRQFRPGDLMIIADQINLTFKNPLVQLFTRRSTKLRDAPRGRSPFDAALQALIAEAARAREIPVRRGVYCGVLGASYETAAEVEMIRRLGADAVGMSTVNEVSLGTALGMKVGGISCITNSATGMAAAPLLHSEVTVVAGRVKKSFETLLAEVLQRLRR